MVHGSEAEYFKGRILFEGDFLSQQSLLSQGLRRSENLPFCISCVSVVKKNLDLFVFRVLNICAMQT